MEESALESWILAAVEGETERHASEEADTKWHAKTTGLKRKQETTTEPNGKQNPVQILKNGAEVVVAFERRYSQHDVRLSSIILKGVAEKSTLSALLCTQSTQFHQSNLSWYTISRAASAIERDEAIGRNSRRRVVQKAAVDSPRARRSGAPLKATQAHHSRLLAPGKHGVS